MQKGCQQQLAALRTRNYFRAARSELRIGNLHPRVFQSFTRVPVTITPSLASSERLRDRLPPNPPSRPAAAITRWHGTPGRVQELMMFPTARYARGRPAAAATSP
jgi:hypothetical protein